MSEEVIKTDSKTPKPKKVKEPKPLDQIKLLFSSLFARQMNSVIIGAEADFDNVIYMSNIDLDEVDMYEQDASKYVHRVSVFRQDWMDALYTLCPLCKDHILYIDTRLFLSALSKEIKNQFFFEITDSDALVLSTDQHHYQVGSMISAYIASLYVEIFRIGEVNNEDEYQKRLELGDISSIGLSMIKVFNNKHNEQEGRIVLAPNKNLVSLKEYPVKSKNDDWVLILKVYGDKVCNIECDFHTNDIKVQSVQPGIRYYMKPVQKTV